MILLKEDTPKKLSGLSSIFLSSPYNPKIVEFIKTLEFYSFDKKTKLWELSCLELSKIIDNLILIDEIELELKDNQLESQQKVEHKVLYKTQPFKYQLEGIEYGLKHDKWLLLDAPGLGKTLQLIYLAEELAARGLIKHCLIICCVNSLKQNWKREIEKHSSKDCVVLGQRMSSRGRIYYDTITNRALQLKNKIDEFFIITNIETFRSEDVVSAFKKSDNEIDMIIVDEIHKCKNKQSIQGSNLLKLNAKYKVGATGTLLVNNPLDVYLPLSWIEAEHSSLGMFHKHYCIKNIDNRIIGFKNMDMLKDELAASSLRRTKDLIDLPPKTIIEEYIEMEDAHQKFYDDVKNGVKKSVDKVRLRISEILPLYLRLRQATACPSILTTSNIESTKLARCVDIVEQILEGSTEKIVIFSTFKETCYVLQEKLKKYNPVVATGGTSDEKIMEMKDKFQEDDDTRVFIATWQKMGTGFTLTRASYAIFIDSPWTFSECEQTEDRIHRIGSKNPIFIYYLICLNTVDEHVMSLVKSKGAIADYIIDGEINNPEILKKYIDTL